MLGILFVILGSLMGKELLEGILDNKTRENQNQIWILLPGAFGIGMLLMGWGTYLVSGAASAIGAEIPLIYGNLAVMGAAAVFLAVLYTGRIRKGWAVLFHKNRKMIKYKKLFQ